MRSIVLSLIVTAAAAGFVQAGATLEVTLKAKIFSPSEATVNEGDSVRICNRDPFFHSPFSYSRYNKFGSPKGIRLAPGQCTTLTANNPTSTSIKWTIFDELHTSERLNITILSSGGKGISGTWRITQTGNGSTYLGNLRISHSGGQITGTAEWDNHSRGAINGYIEGNMIRFTINYGDGLIGTYDAAIDIVRGRMSNGTARSNKGGTAVGWYAELQ